MKKCKNQEHSSLLKSITERKILTYGRSFGVVGKCQFWAETFGQGLIGLLYVLRQEGYKA